MQEPYWHGAGRFSNPEGTPPFRITPWKILKYGLTRMWYPPLSLGKDIPADFVIPEPEALRTLASAEGNTITWLGHCAFLLRLGTKRILTDPFLDGTAGSPLFRTLRRLPPSIKPEALPPIDILLISHMHADHMHMPSLRRLRDKNRMTAVVPLGVGRFLKNSGFKSVIELDWFKKFEQDALAITALPAIHYSDPFANKTLWSGFSIKDSSTGKNVYFSGDTGYGPFLKRDIAPYGPFDAACIGVGAHFRHTKHSNTHDVHTTPEEAVQAAMEIGATRVIGMHWGTVRMADDDNKEIPERFFGAAAALGYKGEASLPRIGETISF